MFKGMVSPVFQAAVLFLVLLRTVAADPKVIYSWQDAFLNQTRTLNFGHQINARYLSILHLAQYEALLANGQAAQPAVDTAVAAFAGHHVLSYYLPQAQSTVFDALIATQLANYTSSQLDAAQAIALPVAASVVLSREGDGNQLWSRYKPAPANGPVGVYQFPINQTYALYPQLGLTTRPWVLISVPTFANLTHPYAAIPSPAYDIDFNRTRLYGGKNNATTLRSQFQTDTGYFWLSSTGTATIVGYWNNVARQLLQANATALQAAHLLALLNVASYDAQITGFYQKYTYLQWRPITAIRQGDVDNKPDPAWEPLVVTPQHPDYPSTHSVASGVAERILARSFGSPLQTFTIKPEDSPGIPPLASRTYTNLTAAAIESGESRIYVGAHFAKAVYDGVDLGRAVADYVFDNFDALGSKFVVASAPTTARTAIAGRRLL